MPTTKIEYTGMHSDERRVHECFTDTDDLPTNSKGKVYFKYRGLNHTGEDVLCECDVSPGARFIKDGQILKMVQGHVRLMCPECALRDVTSALHIDSQNKTIFVANDTPSDLLRYEAPNGDIYLLPSLTVLEPVGCNYREASAGACTWRAIISTGRATKVAGGGQRFVVGG